ncbi:MAG: putative regulatory protein [Acidimicrobiales bacterium]|nr:putative regulatory protein [Acidimicrobiales bacterium]
MTSGSVVAGRSITLTRDLGSVLAAREWLNQEIEPWTLLSPATQADVLVMASELVSNTIMHTRSVPHLMMSRRGDIVRIAVCDDGPGTPEVQPVDPHRVGGNGLRVVATWAHRWGVDPEPGGGKTVWFTVRTA